jgi:mannonate dehydratase
VPEDGGDGETFGVKTAWHGPGDVSPIGHMANVALDWCATTSASRSTRPSNERLMEVFSRLPTTEERLLYVSEKPGWGIEVDEAAAKKYPFGANERGSRQQLNGGWGVIRRRDGTVIKQ